MLTKVHDFFFGEYSAHQFKTFLWLMVFSFGLYMLFRVPYFGEWLTSDGFHYTSQIKNRRQFNPLPLLEQWMKIPFFILVLGSTALYLCGWKQRYMIWILALIAIYIQFVDQAAAFTLNKYYVVIFLISAVELTQAGENPSVVPSWGVRILQATLLVQYFTAGTCKIFHGDWLVESDILWTQIQGLYCTDFSAMLLRTYGPGHRFREIGEWSTLIFEIGAPLMFLIPRVKRLWIVVGIGFHLFIAISMSNLIYFSLQFIIWYVLIIEQTNWKKMCNFLRLSLYGMRK